MGLFSSTLVKRANDLRGSSLSMNYITISSPSFYFSPASSYSFLNRSNSALLLSMPSFVILKTVPRFIHCRCTFEIDKHIFMSNRKNILRHFFYSCRIQGKLWSFLPRILHYIAFLRLSNSTSSMETKITPSSRKRFAASRRRGYIIFNQLVWYRPMVQGCFWSSARLLPCTVPEDQRNCLHKQNHSRYCREGLCKSFWLFGSRIFAEA